MAYPEFDASSFDFRQSLAELLKSFAGGVQQAPQASQSSLWGASNLTPDSKLAAPAPASQTVAPAVPRTPGALETLLGIGGGNTWAQNIVGGNKDAQGLPQGGAGFFNSPVIGLFQRMARSINSAYSPGGPANYGMAANAQQNANQQALQQQRVTISQNQERAKERTALQQLQGVQDVDLQARKEGLPSTLATTDMHKSQTEKNKAETAAIPAKQDWHNELARLNRDKLGLSREQFELNKQKFQADYNTVPAKDKLTYLRTRIDSLETNRPNNDKATQMAMSQEITDLRAQEAALMGSKLGTPKLNLQSGQTGPTNTMTYNPATGQLE